MRMRLKQGRVGGERGTLVVDRCICPSMFAQQYKYRIQGGSAIAAFFLPTTVLRLLLL